MHPRMALYEERKHKNVIEVEYNEQWDDQVNDEY